MVIFPGSVFSSRKVKGMFNVKADFMQGFFSKQGFGLGIKIGKFFWAPSIILLFC